MQQPKKYNESVWDKSNSTYMRIIYLKNGYTLTGYSKKVGRNERQDKVDLLTNWMLRDLKSGYLDIKTTNPKITPVDRVEYFIMKNQAYERVINLCYDFPEWVNIKWLEQKKFSSFIHRLYDMLRRNMSVTTITNALEVRTRAQNNDPLDISNRRFTTMPDLNAFIKKLKNESDLQDEAIEHFYRTYNEKYFTKF